LLAISEQPEFSAQAAAGAAGSSRKLQLPTEDLRKAWAVSRRISKDDWLEWCDVKSCVLKLLNVMFQLKNLIDNKVQFPEEFLRTTG
jgi:hypothetical protein